MDEKIECPHCGGSGTCDKFNDRSSCPDCCHAAGVDLGYFQGFLPCAVCDGTGKIRKTAESEEP